MDIVNSAAMTMSMLVCFWSINFIFFPLDTYLVVRLLDNTITLFVILWETYKHRNIIKVKNHEAKYENKNHYILQTYINIINLQKYKKHEARFENKNKQRKAFFNFF